MIGTTSVLDPVRNHSHLGDGTMMSARGCCAPQPLSGMKCKPPHISFVTLQCCFRNKQDLRDPVSQSQFKLGPGDFPRFLWEDETMDDVDPAIGFLRHRILFAVRVPARSPDQY